jgi:hypothetical protein
MTILPQCPTPPVDLRARFGDRFRVRVEADAATLSAWPEAERVWLLEIRCWYGIVYPFGGEILAAWTDHPRVGAAHSAGYLSS